MNDNTPRDAFPDDQLYVDFSSAERSDALKRNAKIMSAIIKVKGPHVAAKFAIGAIEGFACGLRQIMPLSEIIRSLDNAKACVTKLDEIMADLQAAEEATKH